MNYKEAKQKASSLRKNKNFKSAVKIFSDIWNNQRDKCDKWDGWGYALCLRKTGESNKALEVCREVYNMDPDFEFNNNLYAWCIYDTEIKRDHDDIKKNPGNFFKAAEGIIELVDPDKFSPYNRTVFKVIDYLDYGQNTPANKIIEWIEKLEVNSLSSNPFSFTDSEGEQREAPSDKEKYFAIKTKALEELEEYQKCREWSERALSEIDKFHYDNDIWFKRRIALAEGFLGDPKQAVEELKNLLAYKYEWYIQHNIAFFYYKMENYDQALTFSGAAALNHGKPKFKWELFLLIGDILQTKDQEEMAKRHILLAALLRQENDWKIKGKLKNKMDEHNIELNETQNSKELIKELQSYWEKIKYKYKKKHTGYVKNLIGHGAGFISSDEGGDYYFRVNSFKGPKNKVKSRLKVSFYLKKSYDRKKDRISKEAINIKEIP